MIPAIGEDLAIDVLELIEIDDFSVLVSNDEAPNHLEGLRIEKSQGGGSIAHDQVSAVRGQAPSFSLIGEVSDLLERFLIVDEAPACLPGELVELVIKKCETFAEEIIGKVVDIDDLSGSRLDSAKARMSVLPGRLQEMTVVEEKSLGEGLVAVVRNANAFLAAEVHIIGRRRWNRRGAMVTDRYQHVRHHPEVGAFVEWAGAAGVAVIGIDNIEGSVPIEATALPERCVLVFGQEGPGLSAEMQEAAQMLCAITQYGSTRSINAGVASGIAMYEWLAQHRPLRTS